MSKQKYWRELKSGESAEHAKYCLIESANVWLMPVETLPDWPAPRDARTDPPKENNCIGKMVLGYKAGFWNICHIKDATFTFYQWLSLPPTPEQKSEAERAWEFFATKNATSSHPVEHESFIAGYEAAKKGGGA